MRLNLGCGQNKIHNCINVDIESSVRPDVIADFTKSLPFPDSSVEVVYLFHVIEHIPKKFHDALITEVWRVLKAGGNFFISYPEFIKCAQNFIENKKGMRQFWEHTIYGRQLYPSDTHVSLMYTPEFKQLLLENGFSSVQHKPEINEDYNTMVLATKGAKREDYEDFISKLVFT